MVGLPSGTVSLLFSDIEGSTALLSRLGQLYAEALATQRQVLRKAWSDHGGTELGTEGDSFFVVFRTAEGAAAAAAQAQRDLVDRAWPGGERVRVRVGIHTGTPQVHDGSYVGMDVHRAARIAAAAHGGQVVVSSATAALVSGCLPERTKLLDLGHHRLKDLPGLEHLFQLTLEELPGDFPPLKSLGTASSLPRPATPLVGRSGELAELTALLRLVDVRLVTLTGPGGTGKTRLAIGVAQTLVDAFPDGAYFVDLAPVATGDVMWTTIAEVLDVPPEGRIPPGLFDHLAHRTALFVLDNLEQIDDAPRVVDELLSHAPQVVVIATSRRPLAVPGEHIHPVPPLELPEDETVEHAIATGAVQLFLHHAGRVKPTFRLDSDNVADVTELCRRLDGLPLAIELAAARIRLLTPKAIMARLAQGLDIAASGQHTASRQRTLRDTITWSYNLLTPSQQTFFRRLGVFAGGADLDAVTAVTADILNQSDPLDLLADLLDASLIAVGEGLDGEPRISMLRTIRGYTRDQLRANGELDPTHRRHAEHYLSVATTHELTRTGTSLSLEQRRTLEIELDNMREALTWAFIRPDHAQPDLEATALGRRLCANLGQLWREGGYLEEGRRWIETALGFSEGIADLDVVALHRWLSWILMDLGDASGGFTQASAAVGTARDLHLPATELASVLNAYGGACLAAEHYPAAQRAFQEALALLPDGHPRRVALISNLASTFAALDRHDEAVKLDQAAFEEAEALGDEFGRVLAAAHLGESLLMTGRVEEARERMYAVARKVLEMQVPIFVCEFFDDYAGVLAASGRPHQAARLLGAVEAMRERTGIHRFPSQEANVRERLDKIVAAIGASQAASQREQGRQDRIEDLLAEL